MSEITKIIRRVLDSPRTVTPDELRRLLEYHGYKYRKKISGGSHLYYFTKPGCPPISFPHPHGGKELNVHYVRKIANLLRLETPNDG